MKTPNLEWHGGKAYATCQICKKLVQVNKPFVGALHVCLTDCEYAGKHVGEIVSKRVGLPWRRKTIRYCGRCYTEL